MEENAFYSPNNNKNNSNTKRDITHKIKLFNRTIENLILNITNISKTLYFIFPKKLNRNITFK